MMVMYRSVSMVLGGMLLLGTTPGATVAQDTSPSPASSAAPVPVLTAENADTAAILAALQALSSQVGELQGRVATLEAAAGSRNVTKPKAPKSVGKNVKTVFPDWMRDAYRPESERSDEKNREVIEWRDESDDETGFRVYAQRGYCELKPGADASKELNDKDFRRGRGEVVLIDELPADTTRYEPDHAAIDAALPAMPDSPYSADQSYDVRVSAFNAEGESRKRLVASYFLTPEYRCP